MRVVVGQAGVLLGDCADGFGKYRKEDGSCYEGQWQDGGRPGKGVEINVRDGCLTYRPVAWPTLGKLSLDLIWADQ